MERVSPARPWPLFDVGAIRAIESAAATHLPPHALMQRAGLAVARLALAMAPHARRIWIACGPGNNGGDGFEAALHLQHGGKAPWVTWLGDEARLPDDARRSLARARAAGVTLHAAPPDDCDLVIDALLGIGGRRAPQGVLRDTIERINRIGACGTPVLAVDVPSGLDADTGMAETAVRATATLSLLALKPGLFTAGGRDAAGEVWFDELGVALPVDTPGARLAGPPPQRARRHGTHKGSYGDVAVIGGAPGMGGAAILAGRAALHAGAGRVFVAMLDPDHPALDIQHPDLMFRPPDSLDLSAMAVACGCGGGTAIEAVLPHVLAEARSLVLDADALNAIARAPALQQALQARAQRVPESTVLTPHPLEAARLLGRGTAEVQADRLAAARTLATRLGCTVVLKGSGSVVAAPEGPPSINPTGNARLAIAGTGDVLAGMVAAALAQGGSAFDAAVAATYAHGAAADAWPGDAALTAAALAARV